jgi:hypothetical protein
MKFEERAGKWFWQAGMVVLPLAAVRDSWYQFHAQSHAEALSHARHVFILGLAWAFWSLGGLMWSQKFNRERMAKD